MVGQILVLLNLDILKFHRLHRHCLFAGTDLVLNLSSKQLDLQHSKYHLFKLQLFTDSNFSRTQF